MKKLVVVCIAFSLLFSFVGCNKATPAGESKPSAVTPAQEVTSVALPKFVAVGTGATGGAFYPIGVAIASVLSNNLGVQATAQVTGGALENIQLVQDKGLDMGITMGNAAQDSYEMKAYTNLNGMFGGLSKGYFQIVVLDKSPITTMEDLKGKKICMGPAGNGAISVAETIWSDYGFGINDVKATYLSYDDGVSQLTDGNVDAIVVQAAVPSPAIQQLAASNNSFRFIPVEEAIAKKLTDKYQYFGYGTFAPSIYGNKAPQVNTMYITNMVVVRADLPEEVVYKMTKAIFDNIDVIKGSHKAVSDLTLEEAVRSSVPLHSGAKRYFQEMGVL